MKKQIKKASIRWKKLTTAKKVIRTTITQIAKGPLLFSKELQILDRNTVSYMIDEMQAEIDKANAIIADKDAELAEMKAQNDKTMAEMSAQIAMLTAKLSELNK